ncbi:hexaprenyldihydroxybenzoate methyltransferase [Pichia kluyveri]|uniref:Ubiquinone biosynthesis O-methyltransferase, mitochondrial n=1 Tax=Pichia kluyveri TaxID=36015 RepID=A0AAV5R8X7_PICKL|nr:hexaprenyldihydroxybenzoate methyltransferase [Pichia kluyveri]
MFRRFSTVSRHFNAGKSNFTSITQSEKEHFQQLASTWWDSHGSQRILHKMNILRMDFISDNVRSHIKVNADAETDDEKLFIPGWNHENILPKEISNQINKELDDATWNMYKEMKLQCLDIGCGGGLLSESLARLPNVEKVTGIDMTPEVIEVANQHKLLDPMLSNKLEYKLTSLDDIPNSNKYDIVTCMEMLEHVDYPAIVLDKALSHVKPGGYFFLSTINRDLVSWFTTIFMGEHILKIVPLGTHTFSKYIKESEIRAFVNTLKNEFEIIDSKGCAYLPAVGWFYTPSSNIGNYMMALKRKEVVEPVVLVKEEAK